MRRLVLAVALAVTAAPAFADTPLKRLTLRQDLLGFEGVGRLDMGDGFCSGVLIAPDLVLTAAHCLVDSRTGQRRDPRKVMFRAGFRDGAALAERAGARAVLHPDYAADDPDGLRQLRADLGLLELAEPIPSGLAAPFATGAAPGTGDAVSVVSYARDRAEAPAWQRACGLTLRAQGVLVMSCDTHFGSSGAPVFDTRGGRPRIVSLISRGTREAGETTVYGMEIGPALRAAKAALRAGRGVWPRPEVAPRRLRLGDGGDAPADASGGARFLRP
jgi:protease YdgD